MRSKSVFVILMVVIGVLFCAFSPPVEAQGIVTPSPITAYPAYNQYQLLPADSTTYAKNTYDTLPRSSNYWAANSSTFPVGGHRYVDFEVITKDTMQMTFIVQKRLPSHYGTAAGSWSTAYADSVTNYGSGASNTGKRYVFYLRSPETDYLDGVEHEYRILITYPNYATVIGTSSPYVYYRINWYP